MTKLNYRHALIAIICIHFLIFLLNGLFRHWGFLTTINDTGNFDQAIWGVLHEGYLHTTNIANEPMNRLAGHFDPILYAFVPFYAIFPSVGWLVGAQALALAVAAWPVFLLGQRVFQSEKVAFLLALAFLLNPFVLNAGAWDFHPITLAVPFIALAMLGIDLKNYKLVLLSIFFILLCKEHLGVLVVGLGLVWLYKHKEWLHSVLLIVIGMVHAYVVLIIIMPALSITDRPGAIGRYAWLGDSFSEIIRTMITQPFLVLETAMITFGGFGYLVLLLLPFLFFPLLGLVFLLPGMADLAANMLSANPMPRSPIAYHSATLIPILTIAAIYGVKKISKWQKRFAVKELSALALIATLLMGYAFAPFPLPGAKNVWAPASFIILPDSRVQEISSLVGNEASISVQANVGAHFSQRKEIYRYPNLVDKVDAVILWLESPTQNIHNYPKDNVESRRYIIGMLDSHLQMDRKDYLASIENLVLDDEFGVAYWDEPWLVLKRGEQGKNVVPDVMARLEELREEWR